MALLLLAQGASPNLRFPAILLGSENPDLQTSPLAWAARSGDAGLVRLLLQHGADPSLTEVRTHVDHECLFYCCWFFFPSRTQSTGATPVQLAEQAGHAEVAHLLTRAAACRK